MNVDLELDELGLAGLSDQALRDLEAEARWAMWHLSDPGAEDAITHALDMILDEWQDRAVQLGQ